MGSVPDRGGRRRGRFGQIIEAFVSQPGLPFAQVLSAKRIEAVFARHENLFGGSVYSTSLVVWAFLGQVLRDAKLASCQAAVASIVTYQQLTGGPTPTDDTGDYCRARAKLSVAALRELTVEIGNEAEKQADPAWLWKGRHAKLIDGFTFTMPDTPANQAVYPQSRSQRVGVGFPIARAAVILSLATGCVLDLAIGPYSGKETGETALLREMLPYLMAGDVAVVDRYYCSFLMIALLVQQQVDVCARLNASRRPDFRRGRRLGPDDHLITWTKPARPEWMDEATYAAIPETLTLREIRYCITVPGRRTQVFTIVTTMVDAKEYSRQELAELYGFRWNSELDIRSIKQSLNLDHVRCKSPEMARRELWTTLLGYNLIRVTMAAAAVLHKQQPRSLSFTSACQYVLSNWMTGTHSRSAEQALDNCLVMLKQIAKCRVGRRPGRIEPRVLKRRRHRYPLMTEPREVLRARLDNNR